jgi:hypothetical protein
MGCSFILIPRVNSCVNCTDGCGKGSNIVILTFKVASFSDWRLEAVEGSSTVGTGGNDNPAITLEVGKRYRIINADNIIHPFALTNSTTRGADYLLSEGGTGSFASDAEVNDVKNTDGCRFTLTRTLAHPEAVHAYDLLDSRGKSRGECVILGL